MEAEKDHIHYTIETEPAMSIRKEADERTLKAIDTGINENGAWQGMQDAAFSSPDTKPAKRQTEVCEAKGTGRWTESDRWRPV